jgi:hypothetical protein
MRYVSTRVRENIPAPLGAWLESLGEAWAKNPQPRTIQYQGVELRQCSDENVQVRFNYFSAAGDDVDYGGNLVMLFCDVPGHPGYFDWVGAHKPDLTVLGGG